MYTHVCPKFIGIGVTTVFVSVVMSIYYIYIMAYCLIYLCQGFGNLPWLEGPELELLSRTKDYYLNTVLQKTTENVD